jgi:hypothetical protein
MEYFSSVLKERQIMLLSEGFDLCPGCEWYPGRCLGGWCRNMDCGDFKRSRVIV